MHVNNKTFQVDLSYSGTSLGKFPFKSPTFEFPCGICSYTLLAKQKKRSRSQSTKRHDTDKEGPVSEQEYP